ncbi:MAG: hypothetical protein ACI8Y4_000295 [Candidatus Poriferisodalaceae bacterium]
MAHLRTRSGRVRLGGLGVAAALILFVSACGGGDSGSDDAETSVPVASAPTTEVSNTDVAPTTAAGPAPTTVAPGPTILPIPDPAFAEVAAPADAGLMCAGTLIGISCLLDGEWRNFDGETSPVVEWERSVVACPDGRIVTASPNGIAVFSNGDWGTAEPDFGLGFAEDVACCDDAIWAVRSDVTGRFADGVWTSWNNDEVLGSVEDRYRAQAVEIAPDGSTWVTSRSSIGRFQDDAWTAWEEGAGFENRVAPRSFAIGASADGYEVLVATGSQGIAVFANEAWTNIGTSLNGDDAAYAAGGDIWISAHRVGVERFTDDGGGPALPADAPESWGTSAGTLADADGQPVADAMVEVCVEILYSSFVADTPCGDHPYAAALTDGDGVFEIPNIRAGRYTMSLPLLSGWTFVEDGSSAARFSAVAVDVTDVGTIRLPPVEPVEDSTTTTAG